LSYAIDAIDDLEAEVGGEWPYGAGLIREAAVEDYARELADDIGAINSDAGWPSSCIDWKQAARELAMDYSLVTFLGYAYYVR
jgi:antirestriction protein